MAWFIAAILAAVLIVDLIAHILRPNPNTKTNPNNELIIVVLLKALITHFGAARAAQYYLDALESTKDTDSILRGLYKKAGLPEEYADPILMMKKEGGCTQEQFSQYEQNNAKHRKIVLGILTADLKKAEDRFNDESKAYNEMLRKAFHE
jgi:hypothetical protein